MDSDRGHSRFFHRFSRLPPQPIGPLQKIAALLLAGIVFTVALMLSVFLFAAILTAGAVGGAYLWWKSRGLRKRMRENAARGGLVIEGEVLREIDRDEEKRRHDRDEEKRRQAGAGPRR